MNQWEDYGGDEWLQPNSSRETQLKVSDGHLTKGITKRPRLEKPPWSSGDEVAGFTLGEMIGCGSHGWVFAATEVATGKDHALKIMPSINQREVVRAKTGFRRMSKLRHRGLVRLHRIHHDDDWLAFSMERIHGDNLVHVLRQWSTLPLTEACDRLLEMIRQIGAALAWTHAHQLVHRDIKPTNLMLTDDGERFVIVDCDLTGNFEAESDPENIRSYLIWTPMYVAPEVLFRQSYCPASDIFSLGMVVLEAIRLFTANQNEKVFPVTSRQDESLDDLGSGVPRDEKSCESDREHIVDAISGLHPAVPALLRDTVNEMLSFEVSERPTAMSLSRLGQSFALMQAVGTFSNNESARAMRITETARHQQLVEFRRWTHLVLAGKVQRFHIDGASGSGKSTFLDIALEELRKQTWPLIFTARCQRFEQRPLQAFSQIVDEMIMGVRSGNLEKIRIDSVSESILQRSIPGFNEVLEVDWSEPPIITSPTRPGGLDAAMKVCDELRRVGPLFFVIDDLQWADQDTLQVLDHLQSTIDHRIGPPQYQGMGIITVSRSGGDRQQYQPHTKISLGPLSAEVTRHAIEDVVAQQNLTLTDQQITSLNDQVEGLPYRLQVYLGELAPNGMLNSPILGMASRTSDSPSNHAPTIQELWDCRVEQLDADVRRLLEYLVVAGRQITIDELSLLEESSEYRTGSIRFSLPLLETRLDELAEQRLIVRDGADGQLLSVWHDQLGQQVLNKIPMQRQIEMHRRWAESLSSVLQPLKEDEGGGGSQPLLSKAAGRIAEHFAKGGEQSSFLRWAKIAASQAQHLYAHIEAARWFRIVAENSTGNDKTEALQMAAETLERGGRVYEAAQLYFELSPRLTGQAKLQIELDQVHCFIRSGRFGEVTDRMQPLLKRLKLPQKKASWRTQLSLLGRIGLQTTREKFRTHVSKSGPETRTVLQTNQIAACLRLIRPLSYIDNWLSAELSVFCGDLVKRVGTPNEQIEILVGECVFNSYQPGRSRRKALEFLSELDSRLDRDEDPSRRGDVKAGKAWAMGMAGKFAEVPNYVHQSREAYTASELYHGFEIAHTSYIESTAYFELGKLDSLTSLVENMHAESRTTNDRFVLAMGSLGYACSGFLHRDDVAGLENVHSRLAENLDEICVDGFALVAQTKNLLTAVYQNRSSDTLLAIDRAQLDCKQAVTYRRVQIIQILIDGLMAVSLGSILPHAKPEHVRRFLRYIRRLRGQRIEIADTKADLFEGIALSRHPELFSGDPAKSIDRAVRLLTQAKVSAKEQSLIPSELLAEDELERLAGSSDANRLVDFLKRAGVANPEAFSRLYGN